MAADPNCLCGGCSKARTEREIAAYQARIARLEFLLQLQSKELNRLRAKDSANK